jgi:hypothetical protein
MELTWYDDLVAGPGGDRRALAPALVRTEDFDPLELGAIRAGLGSHPWRELVISVHRTANAAKVARRRRTQSARWNDTPGLRLRTRKVVDEWTAVTAVWVPVTGADHLRSTARAIEARLHDAPTFTRNDDYVSVVLTGNE